MTNSEYEKIFTNIEPEELPEPYNEIAEFLGVETAIGMHELLGGSSTYFPKLLTLKKQKLQEKLLKEFDGRNYKALSNKYGYTVRWIRILINEGLRNQNKSL